jgi:mannose-1-phosphate guanylyltransferase
MCCRNRTLMGQGALWNTFVFVVQGATLWRMFRQAAPDLCTTFNLIRWMLPSAHAGHFIAHAYDTMPSINFSTGVCEPLVSWLRVLPVPECGWSDWGSADRILASLQQIGKLDDLIGRLRRADAADAEAVSSDICTPVSAAVAYKSSYGLPPRV